MSRPLPAEELLRDCLLFDYAALSALALSLADCARRGAACLGRLLPSDFLELLSPGAAASGPALAILVQELQCGSFIAFLEAVTGLRALLPDPYLTGAGVLEIAPGTAAPLRGVDERHPLMQLDPRLVLEVCLDPLWEARWGGGLTAGPTASAEAAAAPGRAWMCALTGTGGEARAVDAAAPRALRVLRLYYYGGLRDAA